MRVGGQRVRALLILLALDAGRVVSARSLIERLWPQERPTNAANALQSLVSRLRVALRQAGLPDGVLESTAVGYRLAASPAAVDALAFESQARAGAQALAGGDPATAARLLREALARWRGPALADVAGEEFAAAPAARLAELRGAALLDRIEAELALGAAGSGLIGELRELTAGDPLAERPAALLMRALAAAGRQAEALAVYQRTRDLLAEDLGVDPSKQLAQAHLAVLRQQVPVATSADPDPDPDRTRTRTGHRTPQRRQPDHRRPERRAAGGRLASAHQLRRPRLRGGRPAQAARRRAPGHADRTGRRGQDPARGRGGRAPDRARLPGAGPLGLVRRARTGDRAVRGAARGPRRGRPARAVDRPARRRRRRRPG